MDLQQRKLIKEEWISIERPIESTEGRIVKLISDGYSDIRITRNETLTLIRFLKNDRG